MKKWIIAIVVIFAILLVLTFLTNLVNRTTKTVPHGIYFQMDDQGNVIKDGAESGWSISKDKAEHRYVVFSIVEIDNKIYFEVNRIQSGFLSEEETGLFRYEAEYDKKTKLLSVTMPSSNGTPYHIPTTEFEMKEFQFKKSGMSIG